MTVYAYYRVSTDRQDYTSQKVGVCEYCKRVGLAIDKEVVDDGVSGCVKAKDRKLWNIVKKARKGDYLITSELSRLGRSTTDVLLTCNKLGQNGVNVYFVKQAMGLDQSPMGKVMLAILSAFAEMERDLIRQRTIEGLKRARERGVQLGRKKGFTFRKCDKNKEVIFDLINKGETLAEISRQFDVSWGTLYRFVKENEIEIKVPRKRRYQTRHPIFDELKDDVIDTLKKAKRVKDVCFKFNVSVATVHKFLKENNIERLGRRGFYQKIGKRYYEIDNKIEPIELTIEEMRKQDRERTKNYPTAEDFYRMYGG